LLVSNLSGESSVASAPQFPVPSGAILAIDGHPHFDLIEESALGVASATTRQNAGSIL